MDVVVAWITVFGVSAVTKVTMKIIGFDVVDVKVVAG